MNFTVAVTMTSAEYVVQIASHFIASCGGSPRHSRYGVFSWHLLAVALTSAAGTFAHHARLSSTIRCTCSKAFGLSWRSGKAWRRVSQMRWVDHCGGKSHWCTMIIERSGFGVSCINLHGCGTVEMRCHWSPILKHV